MKKILLILVSITIMSFTPPNKGNEIAGQWTYESIINKGKETKIEPGKCNVSYLQFRRDTNGKSVDFDQKTCRKAMEKITYSIKDNYIAINGWSFVGKNIAIGTYEVSGKTLKLKFKDITFVLKKL